MVGGLLTRLEKKQKDIQRGRNSENYGVGGIGELIREIKC